ncbi:MAG: alkaline phosphatase family protein [Cyclobacteriaceae bacterium]
MQRTVVINVVGLTSKWIGAHTPFLKQWSGTRWKAAIKPVLPAVTCSAQSTYLTGQWPDRHGVVGNGWYFHDECEVKFWRQSNHLVQAPKIWDQARKLDPAFTCANLFWWYNMYSSVDFSVTPRPNYLADGRKIPDIYSHPSELRDQLQSELGTFPLFDFWGPRTSIKSSKWIADAAKHTEREYRPTLSLVYLPHLDYNFQRHGQNESKVAADLKEIDQVCADLVSFYEDQKVQVIILSEYGITDVNNPIALNRELRRQGYLQIREERGLELLDAGASRAFAVADHQIAHVYVNEPAFIPEVKQLLESTQGVEQVLDLNAKKENHLDHNRSGDLIAIANKDSWFSYYYWLDDKKAPDFARTVDIHKKPGYDPVEMLIDPQIKFLAPKVAGKLIKKKIGFRTLMDLIPLDDSLIKGSHGRIPESKEDWPLLISNSPTEELLATEVFQVILKHLTG